MTTREVHNCPQYSKEWWALRLGIPTASNFGRILTASKLGYSKAAQGYAAELIAERMLGRPLDWGVQGTDTIWTERGSNMEEDARAWYGLYKSEVTEVGFVTTWDGKVGGSPDGLVGDDGLVEIKCRGAKAHAKAMMGLEETASRLQTQGYLWLTGREWIDVIAYNDVLPKRIDRQWRDESVIEAIQSAVAKFLNEMEEAEVKLLALGDVIECDGMTQKLAAEAKASKGGTE